MNTLVIAIIFFLQIITYIVFFDVILSFLVVFWVKFRPKFIYDILDILYLKIRKIIPTRMWNFDFTPLIIILIIYFIISMLLQIFPEVNNQMLSLKN